MKRFAVRAYVKQNDPNVIYTKPKMSENCCSGIPAWPKEIEQNKKKRDAVMGVLEGCMYSAHEKNINYLCPEGRLLQF